MARLAVMAHYDPRGQVAPHVRRQVEALAGSVTDLVVVTTSKLEDDARTFLQSAGRLIERANYGYDFFSYKVGLASVDLADYAEVTICNDTYVGPLVDYSSIFESMAGRPVDFWGMTESERISHHVQSFFITFRPWVVQSSVFRNFWEHMAPVANRAEVIQRFEIGLSKQLYAAGFASTPYFLENEADRRLARRRTQWLALRRTGIPRRRSDLSLLRQRAQEGLNPATGLADRALDDGRMPFVKIDTLRYDPYNLGADRLLDLCEERFPDEFDGVRAFLDSTASLYPDRPRQSVKDIPPAIRLARTRVVYRRAS